MVDAGIIPPVPQQPRGASSSSSRRTVGVLLDKMGLVPGGYEEEVRNALHASSIELGVDLILFYGDVIDASGSERSGSNAIYDLITSDTVDGIIAVSSSLEAVCGTTRLAEFLDRFRALPRCSVGIELPGVPSVIVSGTRAMAELLDHVIDVHGARRILFLQGRPTNPESLERLGAYRHALERHGIPWDPALVGTGNFERQDGYLATQMCLATEGRIDAVVAANDYMALGALRALREHSASHGAAVTGFDDLKLARVGHPPLTTVAQPFSELARCALQLVLDQIAGRAVPMRTELGTRFLLRESCGCRASAIHSDTQVGAPSGADLRGQCLARSRRILESSLAAVPAAAASGVAAMLAARLEEETAGREGALLSALEDLATAAAEEDELTIALHAALRELSMVWRDAFGASVDDLWLRAHNVLVRSQMAAQIQVRQHIQVNLARYLSAGERLSAARDRVGIRRALLDTLAASGVEEACISSFSEPGGALLEPIVGVASGREVSELGAPFPANLLFPTWFASTLGHRTMLVFPLAVERASYGVSCFVYPSGGIGPQILTSQVAAALKNVALHEAIIQQTVLHERSVQERTATTKRLEALAHLAGSVAHDLNNALGPVVGLPDIILEDLDCLSGDVETKARLTADITGIREAAYRATGTIKDLLTLGRRGRTQMAELDLNHLVSETVANRAAGTIRDGRLLTTLHPSPLLVRGAESQLGRVIGNLLRNAVAATGGQKDVSVRTDLVDFAQPTGSYETIEPGQYAVVEVTDSGDGIPHPQLGHIFEPYFALKRSNDTSGSGVGLAIVHAVIKEHNGFVDVRSRPGEGTAFMLYLPISEWEARPEPPRGVQRGRRILVVDDEVGQLRTAERVLGHLGHRVVTMQSGSEAYQCLKASLASDAGVRASSPFELILLDVTLDEEHDGIVWLERIQKLIPGQSCVLMSGHAAPDRANLALQKGVPWLVKPYSAEAMARVLAEAFSQKPTPD